MALYAFDGTWNSAKTGEDLQYHNTNVFRFYDAFHAQSNRNDLYVPGVGTRFGPVGKVIGGVFGMGELPRLDEAYEHLCKTWASGDHVIDVIGFSRGAATTLDFCHILQERGVRLPGTDTVVEAHPRIRFLGVWDVVAGFGLANLGATDLNIGHHLSLPKSMLQYCFHAMALDERRPSFLPTRLHGAYEVWFRGVHSDVGGGNGNRGLNDITLKWMMSKAKAAGLPISQGDIDALQPDSTTPPHFDLKLPLTVRLVAAVDRRHYRVSPIEGCTNPPGSCSIETAVDENIAQELAAETLEVLPAEVRGRVASLWTVAAATAARLDFPIDAATDALLALFQGRIPLVTTDDELRRSQEAVERLVETMIAGARAHGYHELNDFFLTEALFKLQPLFPFTD